MAQRYFHKRDPRVAIVLANGRSFKNFTVIDYDNGVIAPQMPELVENIVRCVEQGIGGLTEISHAEYEEWLKKKEPTLPPRWRDEWQPQRASSPQAIPPCSTSSPSPACPAATEAPVVKTVPTQMFRPGAVRAT